MSKYKAKAVVVDGVRFHSIGEHRRWCELKLLERAGKISELDRQRIFQLHAGLPDDLGGQELIGSYVADFRYFENGHIIIEDFKGFMTPLARWKIKHLEAEYGHKVRITGRRR